MILKNFKQAWQLSKQNRFYICIYILGTALSISLVMILALSLYVKTVNIYPETNRNRLLIVSNAEEREGDNRHSHYLSLKAFNQCIASLQTPEVEAVTAVFDMENQGDIMLPATEENYSVTIKSVDDAFWKVFDFSFQDGKPFTHVDFSSGIKTAAISSSLAKQIFGRTDVTGEIFVLNLEEFRVCGVVKDVPFVANNTYADLWIPYTANVNYRQNKISLNGDQTVGPFIAYILASSESSMEQIREEVIQNVHRYNASIPDKEFSIYGQPETQWQNMLRKDDEPQIGMKEWFMQYGFIFLVLLLIPAIGFSGMTDSQMGRRISEIGIRRTFGASRFSLVYQLINENLLFTLIGGLLGLLISYLGIYIGCDWILNLSLSQNYIHNMPDNIHEMVSFTSIINYKVFFITLLVCVVLNVFSAIIPAWRTTRHQIIDSLNAK